jgi:hypothetical protein
MSRYTEGIRLEDHSLEDVFKAYNVKSEVNFVDTFFGEKEVNTILKACGFETVTGIDRTLEHRIRIGKNEKRADLTFQQDDELFYFEVMSQGGGGKWDSDHHEQIMTKTFKLGLDYGSENVHTFAIAFKEFDAEYLEDIQRMENGYAVHLRFNDSGYYADVYGMEAKATKKTIKLGEFEEYGQKIMDALSFKNRRNKPAEGRYLYIGASHPDVDKSRYAGIELVMYTGNRNVIGIKLHSKVRDLEAFKYISEDLSKIISKTIENCPTFEGRNPQEAKGGTIKFDFNVANFTELDIKELQCIVRGYANALGCSELVS